MITKLPITPILSISLVTILGYSYGSMNTAIDIISPIRRSLYPKSIFLNLIVSIFLLLNIFWVGEINVNPKVLILTKTRCFFETLLPLRIRGINAKELILDFFRSLLILHSYYFFLELLTSSLANTIYLNWRVNYFFFNIIFLKSA